MIMSEIENVVASPETTAAPVYDAGIQNEPAPTPVAAPVSVETVGLAGLSETYKNDPSLKDFKSVDDLAKSYVNAKAMIGGSIRLPAADASPEAIEEFFKKIESVPGVMKFDPNNLDQVYNRLGRPESADKYQVQFNPEINKREDLQSGFLSKAHEIGLNSKQAQGIIDYQNGFIADSVAQIKEQVLNLQEQVRQEFGPEFTNRMQAANAGVQLMGKKYPDIGDLLKQNPIFANHPAVVNLFSNLGRQVVEGSTPTGDVANTRFGGMTSAEAKVEIEAIRADRNHPSKNHRDPNHKQALDKLQELYKIASHSEMQ